MNQWNTKNLGIANIINNNRQYENGNSLKASDLNAVVNVTLSSMDRIDDIEIQKAILFEQYFRSLAGDLTVRWSQIKGTLQTKYFTIPLVTTRFYAKSSVDHDRLAVTVTNNSNSITVSVKETTILNNTTGSSTSTYYFFIEFYLDEACNKYVSKLRGSVEYTNTSTNPGD
jgi:hypothetical protein